MKKIFLFSNLKHVKRRTHVIFSQEYQERLQQVFLDGFKSNDLQSIYYSSINLNSIVAADKQGVCKKLAGFYADSKYNVRF